MAEKQSITIPGHHNIHDGTNGRNLRIDFTLPSLGTTSDTGLLVLVPGFGGHIDSNVYIKMRDNFADKFNLVVIQCDFMGSEFMQSAASFKLKDSGNELKRYLNTEELKQTNENPSILLNILAQKDILFPVDAAIDETKSNFNDMGFMQAIDIITAIEAVKILLSENNLEYNDKKVIGYGHSHGAYLLHLCNRLAPYLFSYIADNSAWIEPVYLSSNRYMYQKLGKMTMQVEFDYLAKRLVLDKKALNLNTLYEQFENQAKMIVFQGTDDNLIDHFAKQEVVSKINNATFLLIDESKVDNHIFKSHTHGLNADFLNMFEYAMENMGTYTNRKTREDFYEVKLSNTKLTVDFSYGLPVFTME